MRTVKFRALFETEEATSKAKKLKSEIKDSEKASEGLNSVLDDMTGGAVSGFKKMTGGIKTAVKGFGALRSAVAATGLGLLLVTVTSLVEYFQNTRDGAKLIDQAFSALGAVTGQLGAAFQALINLDFQGAKDAITGIADAVNDSVKATDELYDAQDRFQEFQKKFIIRQAELNKVITEQDFILKDTTSTFNERREASRKLAEADLELIDLEEKRIEQEIKLIELANKTENNENVRRENILAIKQLQAELINLETTRSTRALDAQKSLREIDEAEKSKLEAEKERKITEEEEDRKQQEKQKELELQEMAAEADKRLKQFEIEKARKKKEAEELAKIQAEAEEKRLAHLEQVRQKEIAIEKANYAAKVQIANLSANILQGLSQLMTKSGEQNKTLAIASILISQGTALAQSLANATSPTPDNLVSGGLAAIAKYATIATKIIGTVRQISSTIKGVNIPQPNISGALPAAAAAGGNSRPSSNQPNVLTLDDIANSFNQDAMRAYVLVNDVNNGQQANRILENQSTL